MGVTAKSCTAGRAGVQTGKGSAGKRLHTRGVWKPGMFSGSMVPEGG